MATAETVGPSNPQHYLWWFPGCPVKVHLALRVVQRLKNRLSDVGDLSPEEGLLFGGTREGATEILDFQPVTNTSVRNVVAGLPAERKSSLVGYYRTETGEAFHLDEQDLSLAQECFAKPYHVFLIVHHNRFGPPTATFFFHDRDGRMADFAFLEFPLDPSLLAAEQQGRMQRSHQAMDQPLAVALPAPFPPPGSYATPKVRQDYGSVLKTVGWICLLALVFALGMLFNNGSFRERFSSVWRAISSPPSKAGPSSSAAQPAEHPSLQLRAVRRNSDLELTWDRDAAVIAAATSGTLSIQDGDSKRLVLFDPAQLRDGSLLYAPRTDQILLALTVTTPAHSFSESVTVILPRAGQPQNYLMPAPMPAPKAPSAPVASSSAPVATSAAPTEATTPAKPSKTFTPPPLAKGISSPAAPVLQDAPVLNDRPTTLAGIPNVAGRPVSPPPPPPAAQLSPLPPASAAATTYEPPAAVVKTQPTLSLEQRRLIMKETIVQVRVSVDKNGKVTKAEPIPEKGTNIFLVSAAVEAAHLWRFKPAQSNHQPVVSESILQFVFKP